VHVQISGVNSSRDRYVGTADYSSRRLPVATSRACRLLALPACLPACLPVAAAAAAAAAARRK